MKVVQINCAAGGSTGTIAKAIHKRLIEQGHESCIFYGGGTATEKNMFRIGGYVSLHSHAVLSRNLGRQGYFSVFATLRFLKRLKMIGPDVIHLHNLHGSYLNLPLLFRYLKKTEAKIVVTLHDCWLFTGKCPHFTVAGCERWKESCGHCSQLSGYPRSKVDTTAKCLRDKKKWLSGFGDRLRVIAVSNWLRDTARASFLAQYTIETIYNGVDHSTFYPMDGAQVRKKYGLGERFVILGVSSNWNEQKGLGEFLRLSEQLAEDEVIVLVGLTREQAAQMPERIVGITRTEDQRELAQLYSAADVFVNTSREETFGLVTAEAMACGTPVVVYDSTACGEIVEPEDGVVLPADRPDLLRDGIASARGMQVQRHTRFCQGQMVDEYLKLYMEMLEH